MLKIANLKLDLLAASFYINLKIILVPNIYIYLQLRQVTYISFVINIVKYDKFEMQIYPINL